MKQPTPGVYESTPAPVSHLRGIAAAQITMGQGLVDVTRIEHEGRSGILFRPRDQHIPVGEGGELQAGEYWPVEGDVVIWIENEGGARVIQDYLVPFLPHDHMEGDGETSIIECLAAGDPFVFDPATNFLHADDGTVEGGIRYVPTPERHAVGRENAQEDVNDPYPGYFVSGVDDEGRDILSPVSTEGSPK